MRLIDVFADVRLGRDLRDLHMRMAQQNSQEFASRIAGAADN
jgi:hypothetical protein